MIPVAHSEQECPEVHFFQNLLQEARFDQMLEHALDPNPSLEDILANEAEQAIWEREVLCHQPEIAIDNFSGFIQVNGIAC